MHHFVGVLTIAWGAALLAALRPACWFLVPEAFLWHKVFGIVVTPLYRKTAGVLLVLLGCAVLSANVWLSRLF